MIRIGILHYDLIILHLKLQVGDWATIHEKHFREKAYCMQLLGNTVESTVVGVQLPPLEIFWPPLDDFCPFASP